MTPIRSSYRDTLKDDESLSLFLQALSEFDRLFCDHIAANDDFTLKLEIHGNQGELIHVRVNNDGFKRPRGVEKRIETKSRQERKSGLRLGHDSV